jgi:hypothetical protein
MIVSSVAHTDDMMKTKPENACQSFCMSLTIKSQQK